MICREGECEGEGRGEGRGEGEVQSGVNWHLIRLTDMTQETAAKISLDLNAQLLRDGCD